MILKETLFEKYREINEGMELEKFMEKIEAIRNIWQEFHHKLRNTIPYFYKQEQVKDLKKVEKDHSIYLIIRLHAWDYLIIDLQTKKAVEKKVAQLIFEDTFFVETFKEIPKEKNYIFINKGDKTETLVDYYLQYEDILKGTTFIDYKVCLGEIQSCFYFDLIRNRSFFKVYDKKQGIKEQYDLEKNQELIQYLKSIKIPSNLLPEEISQENSLQRERKMSQ